MKRVIIPIALLTILIGATLIMAVSFTAGPSISPTPSAERPTTSDNIVCSWQVSGDTTQQWVTWVNGTSIHSGPTAIGLPQQSSTLAAETTRRGETWRCNVTLGNGTSNLTSSVSFTVRNAPPSAPNAADKTMYEDQEDSFNILSTDADGDTVRYQIIDPESPFCTVGLLSGSVTCNPDEGDIGMTNYTYLVFDLQGGFNGKNVTYTVLEVNDPPTLTLTSQAAVEGTLFNYSFGVTDEEGDFPATFTLESNLTSLMLTQTNGSAAYITFNRISHAPVFTEKGTWWARVNVTDNGPSGGPYDEPTASATFILNVTTINHAPNITTDFSAISLEGTQGELFNFTVQANDTDDEDTLSFSISSNCTIVADPWPGEIATIDGSNDNGIGLVSTNLTNDHIACRWVTITVSDGEDTDQETVWLNLTNTNDDPTMHEMSYYGTNTNGNTNMSNLVAVKGMMFSFRVNVTDPDTITYAGETFTFTDNSSLFSIGAANGVLSFMPDDEHVGNHSILITVNDSAGAQDSRALNILINNNTAPTLLPIGDFSCAEDSVCLRYINATDPDPGEDLLFMSNNTDVFPIVDFDQTTWVLNYVPTNDKVGNYSINVTVVDQYGFEDQETFQFSISNVNDRPFFDQDGDGDEDNVTFGTIVEGFTKTVTVNVQDEDLDIGMDNLTYNWSFITDPHNLAAGFTFIDEGIDYFTLQFTPSAAQAGYYELNLSVTDIGNETYWQNVSFTVYEPSSAPGVQRIRPYWNSTGHKTELSFGNASWFPNNFTSINTTENSSITFDARIVNDTSFAGNSLTYRWYVDGSLADTLVNVRPGTNSSLAVSYGYFDAGTRQVKLSAIDQRFSVTNWTWQVNVTNVNREPVLIYELQNISVNTSFTQNDYFAYHWAASGWNGWRQQFYDADDDLYDLSGNNSPYYYAVFPGDGRRAARSTGESSALTYSIAPGYACTLADISISNDDITVDGQTVGMCLVRFRATDPSSAYVESNLVWITISEVQTEEIEVPTSGGGTTTRPRPVPIPIEEPVETPYPVELITPEGVITYANETVEVPIIIKNTWNGTISGIKLNASATNRSEEISFRFSQDSYQSLEEGENVTTTLYIDGYRLEAPLAVVVAAAVESPSYVDRATIMISSLEEQDSGDDVESKIMFARDLLDDNPECQELIELLDKAEEERLKQNFDEALKLVNTAVNGCKYLINQQKEVEKETPKDVFSVMTLGPRQLPAVIVGAVIVLILVVFGIIMIFSGKKNYDI